MSRTTGLIHSASRGWARLALSALQRQSQTPSTMPPANACATCRLRSTNCNNKHVIGSGRDNRSGGAVRKQSTLTGNLACRDGLPGFAERPNLHIERPGRTRLVSDMPDFGGDVVRLYEK